MALHEDEPPKPTDESTEAERVMGNGKDQIV